MVNGHYEFDLTESDVEMLDILEISKGQYHVLDGHKTYDVAMNQKDFTAKSYQLKINATLFDVTIGTPLDKRIASMGYELGANAKVSTIDAPMPGLILEVTVKEGQEVQENDPLIILEAMKMENVINSPCNGVIKSIVVKTGDTVEKSHTLITFEA